MDLHGMPAHKALELVKRNVEGLALMTGGHQARILICILSYSTRQGSPSTGGGGEKGAAAACGRGRRRPGAMTAVTAEAMHDLVSSLPQVFRLVIVTGIGWHSSTQWRSPIREATEKYLRRVCAASAPVYVQKCAA